MVTNVFNNYLLWDSLFVRAKIGMTLSVTTNIYCQTFIWTEKAGTWCRTPLKIEISSSIEKYAYELVDTIICGTSLTTNESILNY